jgi:hypothetical protein
MTVTLDLPDELAERARRSGLFEGNRAISMVEWEIERREACDALFVTLDQIQAVSGPPMTLEEIGAEIKAARIGS